MSMLDQATARRIVARINKPTFKLADHLFISEGGNLLDTRVPNWFEKQPLRQPYRRSFREIDSSLQLRATLTDR